MADKRIMTTKSGKKYWIISITCKECGSKFTYRIRYKPKPGRARTLCDECQEINRQETSRKDNQKRTEAKAEWYQTKYKAYHKNDYITKLGGKPVTNTDFVFWKGKSGLANSAFTHSNEYYVHTDKSTEWRYKHRQICDYCKGRLYWNEHEHGFVCSKCSTVYRED